MSGRDNNVVSREQLRCRQGDVDLFVLILFYRNRFLDLVVMKTHALDRNIVFAGWDGGNINPIFLVGGIDLENDPRAGMVVPVENDQHGIGVILGVDVVELETDGSGIHHFGGGSGRGGGLRGDLSVIVVR